MRGLDVFRMIVAPSSSHSLRASVVRYDVAAVGKFLVTDGALTTLLDNLAVQQLPHLCWRTEFAIPPWVVRILDALNTKLKSAFFPRLLATAAEE
jgi:hypothetical protein